MSQDKEVSAAAARRNEIAKNRLENYRMGTVNVTPHTNFDSELWRAIKIVSASLDENEKTGTAQYSLVVPDRYCNYTGYVHGGATATMLDGLQMCTQSLIMSQEHWQHGGVTRNLQVTYFKPLKKGQSVIVNSQILQSSKTISTLRCELRDAHNNDLLASCTTDLVIMRKAKL